MIKFECPRCKALHHVADSAAGQAIACTKCRQPLRIPAAPRSVPATQPTKPAASKTGDAWFYQRGGTPAGPVAFAELKRLAATGKLAQADLVWRKGMAQWQLAQTIPDLFLPRAAAPTRSGPRNPVPVSEAAADQPVMLELAPPPAVLARPGQPARPIAAHGMAPAQRKLVLVAAVAGLSLCLLSTIAVAVVFWPTESKQGAVQPSAEGSSPSQSPGDSRGPSDSSRAEAKPVPGLPVEPLALRKATPPEGEVQAAIVKPVRFADDPRQIKINAAIDRGVAYLRARLTIDRTLGDPTEKNLYHLQINRRGNDTDIGLPTSHPGIPPFLGLTLLECGVPASDPVIRKAANLIRNAAPELTHTYSLSIAILFLNKLGHARDRELIQNLALQLIAGQTWGGGWDYSCRRLSADERAHLLAYLRDPSPAAAFMSPTVAVMHFQSGRRPIPRRGETNDKSNTQFALLALWVAGKHGVPVERTLGLVEAHFRTSQNADGSWNYATWIPDAPLCDPTTCAGLLGLAVGRGIDKEAKGDVLQDLPSPKPCAFWAGRSARPPFPLVRSAVR